MFTIGLLASGKGSNIQAIIEYIKTEGLSIKPGVVLTDNPSSGALEIAKREGIEHHCIPEKKYKTILSQKTEKEYVRVLKEYKVDLVCLAGFMRVIKEELLGSFTGRTINIHPSLLPAFPGLEAWKQALNYGVKFTGCTTHFVEADIDSGPIILQAVVPVLKDDTPETLHKRIQEKEHIIYPLTIKLIAEGKLSISGRKVYITS
ncbi:MAG: phosphoribosylglycinamide formyltransferase [Candidatus Ratteibacteria bacterium]|nr:phosphoribosylglycinamide formyltransferase [Candidatus Ratteibacteria bacterium]